MPSQTFTLSPLFPEGMVTDYDMNLLKPTQASSLQDVIWNSNGHLSKRGDFYYQSGANPLNANTDKITSCVQWYDQDGQLKLVMGDANGKVAAKVWYTNFVSADTTTASTTCTLASGVPVWPVAVYENEVIVVAPTVTSPAFRWAGATTAGASGTGTITFSTDDDLITGSGTNFTTRFAQDGQYIVITDDDGINWYYLVEKVESDTLLRVANKIGIEGDSGLSWASSPFGYFNLHALVTDGGRASASSTTITGRATSWNTGLTTVAANDTIGQPTDGLRHNVATVGGDTSLTTTAAPGWVSSKPHQVTRKLFGNIVTEHQNRLWMAGLPNYPNRVALLPAGASPSVEYNGIDSSTTNPLAAGQAEFLDVPSPNETGKVTALLSVREPGGLAVFRDRDFYMVYGEWPSVQVQKISSDVGCIGWRAACEVPGGVAWVGVEGIYIHRPGGGVQNLCDGKIRKAWTSAARAVNIQTPGSLTASDIATIAYVDEHLVVYIAARSNPTSTSDGTTWVYSFRNNAWVRWTGIAPRSFSTLRNPGLFGTEALAADQVTNRYLSLSTALRGVAEVSGNGVGGTFFARSGYFLSGTPDQVGRMIDGKIVCSTAGTGQSFVVKVGFAPDTATTVTGNFTSRKIRFRPSSTQMGVSLLATNQQALEITESAGTFTALEIEAVSFTVRKRRARA